MFLRSHSLMLMLALTAVSYLMRVIGAESSVIYTHDPQLVRQSLELGQTLLTNPGQFSAIAGFKYPLTFTIFLTGVYGLTFIAGQLAGAFDSVLAFRVFLFANRESMYLLAVLALNLISVCLIPAIYCAQKGLNKAYAGWLAAGLAAFNLLLIQFGHQPRPHVPYATIAFCACALLVLAAHRVGGWKLLIAATIMSAFTVGSLQSGILISAPFLLAHASRVVHAGRVRWRELASAPTLGSFALFALLSLLLYPNLVGEYGAVIVNYLTGASASFQLGAGSHAFSLGMFDIKHIPQFAAHLQSYQPLLTLLLPLALLHFVFANRRRPRLLLVGGAFPLLNLIVWSLFQGTFPRITAVLTPFIIFAAACLVEDAVLWVHKRRGRGLRELRTLVFALMLAPLIVTSMRLVWVLAQPDTRSLALTWINDKLPAGESILLNFPMITLLPTDETIDRQDADFPGSIGTHWQWLRGRPDIAAPRFAIYNKQYWHSQPDTAADKQAFIDRAGIRFILIRTQSSRQAGDEIIAYAQANGRVIRTFCPTNHAAIAQLPDDMFYHAWLQVWQVDRPGPFVALYDLWQPPDQPPIEDFCRAEA